MAIGDGVSAIATLAMTFGGFSPTAMDDVQATREQIERLQVETAKKKAAAARKRELERARTSSEMAFTDEEGSVWYYVIIDKQVARIESCRTSAQVLRIPEAIEGYPVYELADDCCARLEEVREIICPPNIEQIGSCAFRLCPELRRVVLPEELGTFSATWFQSDSNIEELTLPGSLDVITGRVFEYESLKRLHIGKNVRGVEPGAFSNAKLEEITVDEDNPFIMTDGKALYSHDGKTLLVLARTVDRYEVREGCLSIAKKAFDGRFELHEVILPEGIVRLEPFAFTHAGLKCVTLPSTVRSIGEKAFYYCKELLQIQLNEGLQSIGDSAFEESALQALHIPASIESIGKSITLRTPIVYRGPNRTLEIDPASPALFIDDNGGLYRREDDGIHMVQLMDRETEDYTTIEQVAVIDEHAFSHHYFIRDVRVAEGVRTIGDNAFRHSPKLEHVELPDSIEYIGDNAFLDTALTSFRVPRSCTHLGEHALVTDSIHHGEGEPTLRSIQVAEGNEMFYLHCGILCRRGEGGDWAVLFNSSQAEVMFPETLVGVEEYAFNNARGIRYLSLNPRLKTIKSAGLTTWCWIEHIHIELSEPLEGRTQYDFRFPDTLKSKHGISIGIGGASWVHVPGLMAQYDICLINAHDYHAPRSTESESIGIYEQVVKILERLRDPIMLTDFNRGLYERLLRNYITQICVDIARHDDRDLINDLVDLGYVNNDNLEDITVAVGQLQDAAMTGYLLELKRRRFGHAAFDFDL